MSANDILKQLGPNNSRASNGPHKSVNIPIEGERLERFIKLLETRGIHFDGKWKNYYYGKSGLRKLALAMLDDGLDKIERDLKQASTTE